MKRCVGCGEGGWMVKRSGWGEKVIIRKLKILKPNWMNKKNSKFIKVCYKFILCTILRNNDSLIDRITNVN